MHLLAFAVLACSQPQAPERHGDDTLVIPAPIETAWAAFTEPIAIQRALGVGAASVELRPGGRIEWTAGEGSAEQPPLWASRRVLAHERGAMLAFSLVPPPSEPEWVTQRAGEQWSILYFSPLAHDRTQVTVTTLAQGMGADFGLAIERYSIAAREWVEAVALSFDSASAAGNSALALAAVQEWCSGEWLSESSASDGTLRRERVVLTPILGGTFVEETVWAGGMEGLSLRSRSIYGIDPRSRDMRCWTWNSDGVRSESTLRSEDDALVLRAAAASASVLVKRVRRESVDTHTVETVVDGALVSTQQFKRAQEIPAEWKLLPSVASKQAVANTTAPLSPAYPELQRTSGMVGASQELLWSQLCASDGLVKLWGVAKASIELRIGGAILTHYDAQGELGDARGIRHEILAFDPGRMLAFRTTPPAGAPDFLRAWSAHGWHVLRLEDHANDVTQLITTGCEYATDEAATRSFFERGNAFVQKGIEAQYPLSAASSEALARLAPLMGAKYEARGTVPTGETVRARTTWASWCGPFLSWQGQLAVGDEQELADHTWMLYGPDAAGGARFWKFGADGSVARGTLVADGERGVGHEWRSWSRDGRERDIYVQLVPDDRDYHYRAQPSRTEATTLVSLDYVRR